jgi:hypothetical protein
VAWEAWEDVADLPQGDGERVDVRGDRRPCGIFAFRTIASMQLRRLPADLRA